MKNILFITHLYPYPPDDGGRIVTFNTIKELRKYGHNIFLCTFAEKDISLKEIPLDITYSVIPFSYKNSYDKLIKNLFQKKPYNMEKYINKEMASKINSILEENNIELVYVDHLHMAYYGAMIKEKYPNLPVVLRQHNVESTIFERAVQEESNKLKRIYLKHQYKKLFQYESKIVDIFEEVYTITEEDKYRLHSMNERAKIKNLPAGVDTEKYSPIENIEGNLEPTIVFLGTMSWLPNVNGVEWFIKDIFPKVLAKYPNLKFYIVGKNPPEKIYKYQNMYKENLIITGYVDDERPYIAKADAFIVPLKIGGGMRIKILNALAMKTAIVTTTVGVEGISLGKESILIADSEEQFSSAILDILGDKQFSTETALNGLYEVKQKYSNESILKAHARNLENISNVN
ncbi:MULTISPECIES: glycosyltransferase family 4 protein [Bacillus]|uniref:Glycosyltransferase n=2 Tax=Bacillus cereus group TaxID=86661 RepID=A0A4Y8T650_BACTU|nr:MULTISPECIES: glycosyltransferase family 4 protein [Bacillus]KLA17442.1 hypothetical protein B4087_5591 [Bacillus cereus]KMP63662.1 hypothetical protein TU57_12510 [Bacillus cereus]KXX93928.1 hypothetical protein AT274_13625 [Bacillus cereus]MCG3790424.1 glycosyltransferase family 4 protein [Bacillus sp. UTDS19-33BHI26]MDG1597674.1 glycosyltransferase family 4 protein [Bacillus cereus]